MPRTSYDAPRTLARPQYWGDDAACKDCADEDVFFPVSYEGVNLLIVNAAKEVCARCPVQPQCLDSALERGELHGVWGGLDPEERGAFLQARRDAADGRDSPDAAEEEEAAPAV